MTIEYRFNEALRRLEKAAKKFAGSSRNVADIRRDVAHEITMILDEQFKTSSDPWGKRWAPKKRDNGKPTLIDTSSMRRSFFVSVSGTKIKIINSAEYSGYHQSGTSKMVARKMVPDTGAMPRKWEPRLRKVAKSGVTKYFKEALK
jgi:phage gpG-like protein